MSKCDLAYFATIVAECDGVAVAFRNQWTKLPSTNAVTSATGNITMSPLSGKSGLKTSTPLRVLDVSSAPHGELSK